MKGYCMLWVELVRSLDILMTICYEKSMEWFYSMKYKKFPRKIWFHKIVSCSVSEVHGKPPMPQNEFHGMEGFCYIPWNRFIILWNILYIPWKQNSIAWNKEYNCVENWRYFVNDSCSVNIYNLNSTFIELFVCFRQKIYILSIHGICGFRLWFHGISLSMGSSHQM